MDTESSATQAPGGPSAAPNGPDSPAAAEQGGEQAPAKRKQDPTYHVFEASNTTPPSFTLLTVDERGEEKPVHAQRREAAVAAVRPADKAQAEEETFMVIPADQVKIITRKVAVREQIVETFE